MGCIRHFQYAIKIFRGRQSSGIDLYFKHRHVGLFEEQKLRAFEQFFGLRINFFDENSDSEDNFIEENNDTSR
uniref:Uncharacterized protein n=1 Tax=Romanomermis culicivorax TaxID=13658 RepID=A0A915KEA1_ROMCU